MKRININLAYQKIGEIAKSVNEDYYSVNLEKNSINGIEMTGYINGYGLTKSHNNVPDLIKSVKAMVKPTKTVNTSISNINI